jgi:hypothetical protein
VFPLKCGAAAGFFCKTEDRAGPYRSAGARENRAYESHVERNAAGLA